MPIHCRLQRQVRSLRIADFIDHHIVSILSHERMSDSHKVKVNRRVDLTLNKTSNQHFDGIFDSTQIDRFASEALQRRIQRRVLARPHLPWQKN